MSSYKPKGIFGLSPGLLAILVIGLAVTGVGFQWTRKLERDWLSEQFARTANAHLKFLEEKQKRYEDMFLSLRNLFTVAQGLPWGISPGDFKQVAKEIMGRNEGLAALEWVPLVYHTHRQEIEEFMREQGFAGFEFKDRDLTGRMVRAMPREIYAPILYVEPLTNNSTAHGYDILLARTRPQQDLARDHGETVATPLIELVQSQGLKNGLIFLLPVYGNMSGPLTVSERRRLLRGYVQVVCYSKVLFDSIFKELAISGLDILVLDKTDESRPSVLAFELARNNGRRELSKSPMDSTHLEELQGELVMVQPFSIGRRRWVVQLRASKGWLNEQGTVLEWCVLIGGVILTGMTARQHHLGERRRRLVEEQVLLRTSELRRSNHALESEITERKAVEQTLRKTQSTLEVAQRLGMTGSWEVNLISDTLSWSKQMYRIFHEDEVEFKPTREKFYERVHPEDVEMVRSAVKHAMATGLAYHVEHRILLPDGGVRYLLEHAEIILDQSGLPIQMIGSAQDITSRKEEELKNIRLSEKQLESQRLESLGVLAGGIAHDFNNILTGILGNASLLRSGFERETADRTKLQEIESYCVRAADLCRQLLAYAGKGRQVLEPVDLGRLARDSRHLFKVTPEKRVTLRLDCPGGLPKVFGDKSQLNQIVMNLVINASEAIKDSSGVVTISTFKETVSGDGPTLPHRFSPVFPGDYVVLLVSDTGCGIRDDLIPRIFDPFYSTKFAGRGIGLAAVIGIVRSHQGFIEVQSEVGVGSRFKVYLPASQHTATTISEHATPPDQLTQPSIDWRGGGVVLVVDDEEMVRKFVANVLLQRGFRVVLAENGAIGVERFYSMKSKIRLVVMDLTMPVMDGVAAYERIKELESETEFLIMSGYNQEETLSKFKGRGVRGFLHKPFSSEQLDEAVRLALGA